MGDYFPCDKCGKSTHINMLDAKPKSLADKQATQAMLVTAADKGEDFIVMQCKSCYGPAWSQALFAGLP